jgi:Plavaka transposase
LLMYLLSQRLTVARRPSQVSTTHLSMVRTSYFKFSLLQRTDQLNVSGQPCNEQGDFLPPDTPPPPRYPTHKFDDWAPFGSRIEFDTAKLLYSRSQMSASNINALLEIWAATLVKFGATPPFSNSSDLYSTIDSIPLGDIPWQSFSVKYSEECPIHAPVPEWMTAEYEVWFRDPHLVIKNMIGNPDYKDSFDTAPIQVFDGNGDRKYENFMSGDWAWEEAVGF